MNTFSLIRDVMAIESLDGLAEFLSSQPEDEVRGELLAALDPLLEYDDADQWASAVRLCECLAIIGWGERERIDAISRFNGDCWETRFINANNEDRFRRGGWSKRKAGWVLRNPEYHFSPDRPDKAEEDWHVHAGTTFPTVDRPDLPSQRNCQRQMPIVMDGFGGFNKTSLAASAMKQQLTAHLRDAMRPDCYGDALERFYFTLHCPALSRSPAAALEVGSYNVKQRAFYCKLSFDDGFGDLPADQQRKYFAENLLAAIDALDAKLRKRKIPYDIQGFRADVVTAIDNWLQAVDVD